MLPVVALVEAQRDTGEYTAGKQHQNQKALALHLGDGGQGLGLDCLVAGVALDLH